MTSYTLKPIDPIYSEKLDKAFGVQNCLIEVNPGKCILPPHHVDIAQQIFDAPVRKDDVWLISYPRTGSTWCQEMVWLLGNNLDFETAKNTIQQFRAPLIETSTALREYHTVLKPIVENSVEYVNLMPSPRYIKSHLPFDILPTQLDKIKPKIIYTCRNPKDMCVSYYLHMKMAHNLNIVFEEFCDLLIKDLVPPGPVFNHYLSFWNKRHEENILFLKYEDMKEDIRGTVYKIAKFLGKKYTENEYDSLCDFLSFHKMQTNKGCNLQLMMDSKRGHDYFNKSGQHFIRKGIVGDWKNYMSPELSKRFDDWIEENTRGTGLTFD